MGYIDKNPALAVGKTPSSLFRYIKKENRAAHQETNPESPRHGDRAGYVTLPTDAGVGNGSGGRSEIRNVTGRRSEVRNFRAGTSPYAGGRDPHPWQPTKTGERYRVRISQSSANQLKALGSPAFPGTYVKWREEVYKAFRAAGVT